LHHRRNLLAHIRYLRLVSTVASLWGSVIHLLLVDALISWIHSWPIILPLVHSTIVIVLRSVVTEASIVERWATIKLSLDKEENLLNKVNGVRSLKKIGVKLARDKLLSLVIEVSLVLSLCLHLLADIGKLVVGNIELLAFEIEAVEVATCKCGHIWLFKAHKGAS